ncbi:terpenoid synthase [Ascobolus immersus RN42]|uniref:Terpenoid synthase n=1 Tax=Ascobolus immersus RN42 TaxID=1160509 RepID=A0A3N4I279_ASCIM|nr:terpenoid synthase [Ascobolus immersus RN42]
MAKIAMAGSKGLELAMVSGYWPLGRPSTDADAAGQGPSWGICFPSSVGHIGPCPIPIVFRIRNRLHLQLYLPVEIHQQLLPSRISINMGNVTAAVTGSRPSTSTKSKAPSAHYDKLPRNATPKETYVAILRDFFQGVSFTDFAAPPENEAAMSVIRAELHEHFTSGFLPEPDYLSLLRILPHASSYASVPYPNNPLEVQIFVCKFTLYFIFIDDKVDTVPAEILPHLNTFPLLMADSLPAAELEKAYPVLRLAADNLRLNTRTHFSGYHTGSILKGAIDYTMGCTIEAIDLIRSREGKCLVGEQYEPLDTLNMMQKYTRFLRLKTALSEGFTSFLFPLGVFPDELNYLPDVAPIVPTMVDFIDFVNDIMSYYKETVVGDEKTYFTIMEKMTGVRSMELLKRECNNMVELVEGVRRLLAENRPLLVQFNSFVDGLGEVGIGEPKRVVMAEK